MICITWYEPTDYGFKECHYCCDKLGAYEYDELLWIIKAENYEYYIEDKTESASAKKNLTATATKFHYVRASSK